MLIPKSPPCLFSDPVGMHQNSIKDTNNNSDNSLLSDQKEKLIQAIKRIKHELDESREAEGYAFGEARQVEYKFEYLEREVRSEFENLHRFLEKEEERDMERLKREREKQVNLLKARERKIYQQGSDLQRAIETLNAKLTEDDSPRLIREIQDLVKRSNVRFLPPPVVETEVRTGQFVGPIQYRIWKHMRSSLYPNITSVTFDPETAHPNLSLSPSHTSVWFDEEEKVITDCPANPRRFNYYYHLMGQQKFTCGRHYWEVEVAGKTAWRLGVAQEDVQRGMVPSICDSCGFWTISLTGSTIVACTDPLPTVVKVSNKLLRIGVFLNFEEEELSFYNAVTMAPLFTFRMGRVVVPLYPFFNPCDTDDGKNIGPLNIFSPSL